MRTKSTDRPIAFVRNGAAEFPRPSCLHANSGGPENVVLALGSNVGDREIHLRRAIHGLSRHVSVVALSSIWETAPVGCRDGSDRFLNLVLAGWTRLDPAGLLSAIESVESAGGRRRRMRNDPRTIDVDILFFGVRYIRTAALTVPHPRFSHRNFVLEPLREIAETVPLPRFAGELERMKGDGAVRRLGRLY